MLRASLFKFLRTIAVVLSLAAIGHAQLFSLSGGNFQLAGGAGPVANGSVILTLSNPAAIVIATGATATPVYTINLDANGNMPLTMVNGNAALSPPGTFYTAQLFSGPNGTGTLISTSTWPVGPSAPYSGTLYPNVMVLPAVSFTGGVTVPSSTIAFSATPTFNAGSVSKFYMALSGNVTSSTLTGAVKDQLLIFVISQDGVGSRTFTWPTNVKGQSIASGAGLTSTQAFSYDGTNAWPIGGMTVSSGNTDVRGNNAVFTGTLAATGASTLAAVTATSGVPLTALSGASTNMQINLGRSATEANIAIPQANGFYFTNSDLAAGDVVIRNQTAGRKIYLGTGSSGASVAVTNGGLNLYTATGTLPATISNDTTGGINLTPSGGVGWEIVSDGRLFSLPGKTINLEGATSGILTLQVPAVAGSNALTFPAVTDTLVGKATTDTLTNKTLTAPIIGTTTISEAPRMVLAVGFQTGNLAAGIIGSSPTSKPVTVEAIQVHSATSSVCSVNPTMRVRNAGATINTPTLTLTTGTSDWSTVGNAVNYAGSDILFIEITSAGTCTTPPSNIVVNVTGRMQ